MNERKKFINEWLLEDWSMSDLCRAYGISRKTGYKWLERFKLSGMAELHDQSRAHRLHPSTTAEPLKAQIVQLRHDHPFWGPRKLRKRLQKLHPDQAWPASSTIGSILKRHGLVIARRRRWRTPGFVGPLSQGLMPNDMWAIDFKGWFKTADGARIDPLTVSDSASRYLIRCRAVAQTTGDRVRGQLTSAFQEFGMPKVVRTDNGVPFATVGLGGLSELSVWLIRLGITPERIRPGKPQENGAHERMHKTMKQETANPPRANLIEQQRAFNRFQKDYNEIRPHESLGMETPGDFYIPSPRAFPKKLPEVEYSTGATIRLVTTNGTINFRDKRIYLSNALIDQYVRLEETTSSWDVWYGPVQLGQLDLERGIIKRQPTKVLPMIPV